MPEDIEQVEQVEQVEGGATPDQVMEAQQAQEQAMIDSIAAQAPEPQKPYTYKTVKRLSDAMEAFVEAASPEVDYPEYMIPEGQDQVQGKLPPEVFVNYVKIVAFLSTMEEAQKYNLIKPEDLLSDTVIGVAAQTFNKMMGDKKLLTALTEGEEEEVEATPEEVVVEDPTGEYSEEDRQLMEMK